MASEHVMLLFHTPLSEMIGTDEGFVLTVTSIEQWTYRFSSFIEKEMWINAAEANIF